MEIASAVVGKLLEYTVTPMGLQFDYRIFYESNVNKLKEKHRELGTKRESLRHVVNEARRNGEEILPDVVEWLQRVDELAGLADKFSQEDSRANVGCSCMSFINLWSRHQLSRRAKEMAEQVVKLKEEGKFDRVSYRQPLQWAATSSTSFYLRGEAFVSRVITLNGIIDALADITINMVGIYGLGGVGKTTLAKEVAKKAQGENLYDMVVMVEIKQNPNYRTIQREIAEMVGEESEVIRASRLCQRLKQEKKLLVILDDIWKGLDLRKIGIPLPDECKGCKILLTSRSEEVLCNEMNCKKNFNVGVLSEEEAWDLFKEKAELHDDSDSDLHTIASQVTKSCGGLPIAIVTIARALRSKNHFEWRDTLRHLQNPTLTHDTGATEVLHSSLKLSYDHLESKEMKLVFLLIAMLADNAHTDVLHNHCVGLGIFQGIYTIEGARDRLLTLIQKLKASCLLLQDTTFGDGFQMHDVVRAVALSIAYNEQNSFVVSNDKIYEWPDLRNCKFICLHYCDIKELPPKFSCPSLEALLLSCKETTMRIPEQFFEEMPSLRVMNLTGFDLSSLPATIILLTNLTTLCLDGCVLGDTAMIGELKNLKVLSLVESTIQQLPQELGQLTELQLLNLRGCINLEVIPENVISRLKKLEVLYLDDSFVEWQEGGLNSKTGNARVEELKHLTNLSTLYMHIPDASILPKNLSLDKLERYKLLAGDDWDWSSKYEASKTLKLKLNSSVHSEYGLKRLLERVEVLYLNELPGIKDVVYELNKRGFPYLKSLWIQNNAQIECIINSTHVAHACDAFPKLETLILANMMHLQKLCRGRLTMKSFGELRVIKVESCHQMRSLFSISLVRYFSQLEKIKISMLGFKIYITVILERNQPPSDGGYKRH
ncbi:hypothetical protein L6164_037409 [Bauhinia variegata]|uniref:Uncharacterized protein n=1 Tax=Bauhinia variegata TaxID=167791 RepID=A0ACB9KKQ8_BAUVA|nr:hypothetical protein L6164_037409 [Bauhinia variegata]